MKPRGGKFFVIFFVIFIPSGPGVLLSLEVHTDVCMYIIVSAAGIYLWILNKIRNFNTYMAFESLFVDFEVA